MILNIFVHEFQYNVGHSRAMIEVLNHLPEESIERINIICYEGDDLKKILPRLHHKSKIHKVPFSFLKPFLIKSLFFQIYTSLFWRKENPQKEINITMGVCSFVGDVINIQFAHFLWNDLYFKVTHNGIIKNFYKKIYFSYLNACERYYYRKDGVRFVFLSRFMQEEFLKTFNLRPKQVALAYSSANIEKFSPSPISQIEIFKELCHLHPELNNLNLEKPTYLFIGAFERKGLPSILGKIPKNSNFVIVGKPEVGSKIQIPQSPNTFYVEHTHYVEKFYQCFDIFVFPTLFEPFGLVILEAAMWGMTILVSKEKVGASEILHDLEGISFIDALDFELPQPHKVLPETRKQRYLERRDKLSTYTWESCSAKWAQILNQII